MGGIADRPTADLVVLLAAAVLALVVLLAGAGIFVVIVWLPERDWSDVVVAYGNFVGTLLGAVLGYAAGRGGRRAGEPR